MHHKSVQLPACKLYIDSFASKKQRNFNFLGCSGETKHWSKYLLILMCLMLANCIFNKLLVLWFVCDFDILCRVISIYYSDNNNFRKNQILWFWRKAVDILNIYICKIHKRTLMVLLRPWFQLHFFNTLVHSGYTTRQWIIKWLSFKSHVQ